MGLDRRTAAYVESEMAPATGVHFRRSFRRAQFTPKCEGDWKSTPVILNSFNRPKYLEQAVASLQSRGYENIYVVDNASTYQPLLDYYERSGLRVYYLSQNVGYLALWKTGVFADFAGKHYVYSDGDVVLDGDCPSDFIEQLAGVLDRFPAISKVGMGLRIDDLPAGVLARQVAEHEARFWERELESGVYDAPVDTTMALYRPDAKGGWWLPAARTGSPLLARHMPWYEDSATLDAEARQYLKVAKRTTHWSSSVARRVASQGKFNTYFDCVYCINLDRRLDRWEVAAEQFQRMGIEVERVSAVDGRLLQDLPGSIMMAQSSAAIPGAVGCALSHRRVMERAATAGFRRILVLEDDIEFDADAEPRFCEDIKAVPQDWGMLYLGGNHQGGLYPAGKNVWRTGGTFTTSCYAVSRKTIQLLARELPDSPSEVNVPVDVFYAGLHRVIPSYVIKPHIAWQADGFSDIEQSHMEYGFLRDKTA